MLYCPSGRVRLRTRDIKEFPSTLFHIDEASDPLLCLTFSGDGSSVMCLSGMTVYKSTSDGRELQIFSPPEDSEEEGFQLLGFSHTGRYILWREYRSEMLNLVLQDTLSGQRHLLPEDPEMIGKTEFSFSSNEFRLVGIYQFGTEAGTLERHVVVWSLEEVPVLYGKKLLQHAILQSFLDDETKTLYLALGGSTYRLWQRLSLSDPALTDLDNPTAEATAAHILQEVSADARWLATLQHEGKRYVYRAYRTVRILIWV